MDNLYMFAIMPPAELSARINMERELFAEKYKCIKALKPPVHITLYEPFKSSYEAEQKIDGIRGWAATRAPFNIELKNYNFFKNPNSPVVYIDVVKNESLKALRKGFVKQLKSHIEIEPNTNPFNPHLTIGYRDVPPTIFPAIVEEYLMRRFSASFECTAIYLWKHNGANWQIQNEFELKGETRPPDAPASGQPTLF